MEFTFRFRFGVLGNRFCFSRVFACDKYLWLMAKRYA